MTSLISTLAMAKWHGIAQLRNSWKTRRMCADITASLPNSRKDRCWLEQAESDLKALQIRNMSVPTCIDVCMLSCLLHRTSDCENALKAGR